MQTDNQLTLENGAKLSFACYGREDGIPAFYFHGLPGSRREGMLLHKACEGAGVRLVAPERPGYGESERIAFYHREQWPQFVAELADHLGFERFYLFAASGGAPYGLACASALHHRVLGTGICCGLADITKPELLAFMPGLARFGFWMARHHPILLKYSYGALVSAAAKLASHLSIGLLAWVQGPPDSSSLLQSETRRIFSDNLRESFRHGPYGGLTDMCLAMEPWSFDLSHIGSLLLWHGNQDHVVPLEHSRWLAHQLPTAKLHIFKDEGHFSLPVRFAATLVKSVVVNKDI